MRIPILAGRGFSAADVADTNTKIAMISAALAQRVWPNQSALGKQIRIGAADAPARTIVGVVGNVRHSGLDAETTMQWYIPERQMFFADNQEVLIVRTAGDPSAVSSAVRRVISSTQRAVVKTPTMDQVVSRRRASVVWPSCCSRIRHGRAAAGGRGDLRRARARVAERTRRDGVRSALGATPGTSSCWWSAKADVGHDWDQLDWRVVRAHAVPTNALFGVAPNDPATLVGVRVAVGCYGRRTFDSGDAGRPVDPSSFAGR
jgi:hypothetical protein